MVIIGKVRFGEQEYFERVWTTGTDTGAAEYLRADSQGHVFKYEPALGEQLVYDFTTKVGDHREFSEPLGEGIMTYRVTLETASDVIRTPLGIFKKCLRVAFDAPGARDEEYWEWFARGVGLVRIRSCWVDLILIDTNV